MGTSDSASNLAFVDVSNDYIYQYLEHCCTNRQIFYPLFVTAGLANRTVVHHRVLVESRGYALYVLVCPSLCDCASVQLIISRHMM